MKRWDLTTLASNVGLEIQRRFDHLHRLLAPYLKQRRNPHADTTAIEKLIIEAFEHAEQMSVLADIVVGAASGRYPLHGVRPWMLEGEHASIRHPFEEGTRREWLAAAAIAQFCSEIARATAAVRANLHDFENTHDPDVGMTAMGIAQWNYHIEEVMQAFSQVSAFLFGGPLEDVDWRALGLLHMIPEPYRSQILARCEARYGKALAKYRLPTPESEVAEAVAEWTQRTGKTEEQFWQQGQEHLEIEKIDMQMSAYGWAKERMAQDARIKALANLREEQIRKAQEPKPVSKSTLRGREIAAKRQEALQRREAKKRQKLEAKRAAKNVEESGSPPSSDTDKG